MSDERLGRWLELEEEREEPEDPDEETFVRDLASDEFSFMDELAAERSRRHKTADDVRRAIFRGRRRRG